MSGMKGATVCFALVATEKRVASSWRRCGLRARAGGTSRAGSEPARALCEKAKPSLTFTIDWKWKRNADHPKN